MFCFWTKITTNVGDHAESLSASLSFTSKYLNVNKDTITSKTVKLQLVATAPYGH